MRPLPRTRRRWPGRRATVRKSLPRQRRWERGRKDPASRNRRSRVPLDRDPSRRSPRRRAFARAQWEEAASSHREPSGPPGSAGARPRASVRRFASPPRRSRARRCAAGRPERPAPPPRRARPQTPQEVISWTDISLQAAPVESPRGDSLRVPADSPLPHPGPRDPVALRTGIHPVLRALRPLHDRDGPSAHSSVGAGRVSRTRDDRGPGRRDKRVCAARRDSAVLVLPQARRRGIPLGGRDAEGNRVPRRGVASSGRPRPAEAASRAIDAGSLPPFAVVRAMVEHVPEFLRGEKTGEEILFCPARLPLWFEYFSNDNLLYQINNRLGAEAVARALPRGATATVVEVGGGSGSAALAVAERFSRDARLSRIARYVFSEIVPTFLRRAERALKSRYPGLPVEYVGLDMDRDFQEQGVPRGIADVVYAVNTVHVARDLNATLAQIRETLKPGGAAVFSECVRPFEGQPIYVEFVFNFLENFTGVATDAATRPNHGFLTPDNWRKAFEKAGFEEPEILPDVEELAKHYDAFFVAAVTARRPREVAAV